MQFIIFWCVSSKTEENIEWFLHAKSTTNDNKLKFERQTESSTFTFTTVSSRNMIIVELTSSQLEAKAFPLSWGEYPILGVSTTCIGLAKAHHSLNRLLLFIWNDKCTDYGRMDKWKPENISTFEWSGLLVATTDIITIYNIYIDGSDRQRQRKRDNENENKTQRQYSKWKINSFVSIVFFDFVSYVIRWWTTISAQKMIITFRWLLTE